MNRARLTLPALCAVALSLVGTAQAQTRQPPGPARDQAEAADARTEAAPAKPTGGTADEVEALRRRLEEVESQNRALTQTLREVKARLEELSPPAEGGVVA